MKIWEDLGDDKQALMVLRHQFTRRKTSLTNTA